MRSLWAGCLPTWTQGQHERGVLLIDTARLKHLVRQLDLTTRVTVDSIDEALLLARELKTRGAHDLFRGQCNARWGVSPSLFRIPDEAKEEVRNRLSRLHHFLQGTEGVSYPADDDTVFAIAQHYGIPTNLVDFTSDPDVAAFFAWDMNGATPSPGQMACIFALNVSDFTECWAPGGFGRASVKCDPTRKS